jgi:hypothetical protein
VEKTLWNLESKPITGEIISRKSKLALPSYENLDPIKISLLREVKLVRKSWRGELIMIAGLSMKTSSSIERFRLFACRLAKSTT